MPRHLFLLLLLTFTTGIATGVFIYFQTRTEPDGQALNSSQEQTGFEILGYTYGGCSRNGCSSYRIQNDGTYTFITRIPGGQDKRFSDTLSKNRITEINSSLQEIDFPQIFKREFTGVCPIEYDGVAYRFEIRIEGERYSLDSCREGLTNQPSFTLLIDYFEIFSLTHRNE